MSSIWCLLEPVAGGTSNEEIQKAKKSFYFVSFQGITNLTRKLRAILSLRSLLKIVLQEPDG